MLQELDARGRPVEPDPAAIAPKHEPKAEPADHHDCPALAVGTYGVRIHELGGDFLQGEFDGLVLPHVAASYGVDIVIVKLSD